MKNGHKAFKHSLNCTLFRKFTLILSLYQVLDIFRNEFILYMSYFLYFNLTYTSFEGYTETFKIQLVVQVKLTIRSVQNSSLQDKYKQIF